MSYYYNGSVYDTADDVIEVALRHWCGNTAPVLLACNPTAAAASMCDAGFFPRRVKLYGCTQPDGEPAMVTIKVPAEELAQRIRGLQVRAVAEAMAGKDERAAYIAVRELVHASGSAAALFKDYGAPVDPPKLHDDWEHTETLVWISRAQQMAPP